MFFLKKREIIGIDIGASSIKLVQLKRQGENYRIVKMGLAPLPQNAVVDNIFTEHSIIVSTIKSLMSQTSVKIKRVASSISGNSVIIRKIFLPSISSNELEEEIKWEAEQYIPFDINDVNLDFQILGSDRQDPDKMEVLLVASKKEIINNYVAVFSETGLKLSIIDIDSFAVQNAFEINHDVTPEEIVALINIGAGMMNINVVRNGTTLFTRDVQMGGNLYTEEIQKLTGNSIEEAETMKKSGFASLPPALSASIEKNNDIIAQEIHRSLDFYNSTANEERVTSIFITGGSSKIYNLAETISEKMSLPVDTINPFAKVEYDKNEFSDEYIREIAPYMSVAVGLACRTGEDI